MWTKCISLACSLKKVVSVLLSKNIFFQLCVFFSNERTVFSISASFTVKVYITSVVWADYVSITLKYDILCKVQVV